MAQARSGEAWPATDEGNRLFRAWLASICATIANLGPSPIRSIPPIVGEDPRTTTTPMLYKGAYVLEPKPSSRAVLLDFQQQLVYGLAALAWSGQGKTGGDPNALELAGPLGVMTIDGSRVQVGSVPPLTLPGVGFGTTGLSDTGIIPAIPIVTGLVIVACVAILAGAVGWIASQASEVTSVGVQQTGKTTAAVQAMTKASDIVEAHQARETDEKREIPYDPEELALLKTLRETIAQTAGWSPPALRSVPDVRGATGNIGKGLAIGEIIFLALGGYALVKYASK